MNKDFFKAVVKTAGIAGVFLITNLLVFQIPSLQAQYAGFVYPVQTLYLLFFVFSVIILFALYKISEISASQTGFVFLGLITLKAVGSYFVAQPIISKTIDTTTERVNFLLIFMLFLSIEAYFTVQLLNKKQ
jgi:hypothetical protein